MQLRAQAGPQLRALRRSTKRLRGGSCRSEVRKQKLRRRLLSSGAWKNNQEVSRNRQIHQRSETIKLKLCWLPNLPPRIWESDAGEEPFTRQPGKKKKSYSSGNSFTSSMQIRAGCHWRFLRSGREQNLLPITAVTHHRSSIPTLWVIFSKKSSKFSGCNLQFMIACNQRHHLARICVQTSNSMPLHMQMRQLLYRSFGTNDCTWADKNN